VASIGILPALAVVAGSIHGLVSDAGWLKAWALLLLAIGGWLAWSLAYLPRLPRNTLGAWPTVIVLAAGFFGAAAVLAADARARALDTPLRTALDREFGGFLLGTPGPAGRHDPVPTRAILIEDASYTPDFSTLRARVLAIRVRDRWRAAPGAVTLTVGGRMSPEQVGEWRAGRTIETFASFRRPTRYLNDGVPDFERALALDGTTLFGSVKSGLLVEVRARGGPIEEAAARLRHHVRRSVERWVGRHDAVTAAIVTAVLIGDRTGLPDEVRLRLQAAGTYHVIAISGGNIAICAALTLGLLFVCGVTGRPAALVTLLLLVAYAQVVTAGASVWRATLMAILYLSARLLDHRSPPWQAIALTAALVICARPLEVRDAGFILTFGATAALLEAARRASHAASGRRIAAWLLASLAASVAVEFALLPVSASIFSRVTSAGLVLNLAAVPLMGLVQVAGTLLVVVDRVETIAAPAGWLAHAAAGALVGSARLVDVVPWLAARVPPPAAPVVMAYYLGLAGALAARGLPRVCGVLICAASTAAIITGRSIPAIGAVDAGPGLHVTAFDVGQGDATLVQFPDRSTLLVDTGGIPFGGGGFDIGSRVVSPALWARGIRALDTLLLTHGDPDHIGGARAILDDFAPSHVWAGIPVARHPGLRTVLDRAREAGARLEQRAVGDQMRFGGVRVRVLHPPPPDWERRRVRNDDSVVLELLYGNAAVLLMGDVGAAVERAIVPSLTPAGIRILKVAHHGSRTSTSPELLARWRPQIAVISCGRGNTFGHPAPEVLDRLESIGAAIYRTDLDGQVTIDTDGRHVQVRTFVGGRK